MTMEANKNPGNKENNNSKNKNQRPKMSLDEASKKFDLKYYGASSNIKTGEITKEKKDGSLGKLSKFLEKKNQEQMDLIFGKKIEEAKRFSEGDPNVNFSFEQFNDLCKEVYEMKDESMRNKFAENLINISTGLSNRINLEEHIGASSDIKTGKIFKRNEKGQFVEMSEKLKQESKDQQELLNYSKNVNNFNTLDPNLVNPTAKKLNQNQESVEDNEEEDENSQNEKRAEEKSFEEKIENKDKLKKKGVGMTWPTPNKKVAYYIEKMFTADLSKGEHWKIAGELGKDLSKLGSEYLITTPLGIEKNRKKIKDEIEKVMDYPGFEELIKNDKFMKKNNIKRPSQLSSLLEKLQEPGFDIFKEDKDKLKNTEKKIIKKAIDIFNYYKTTKDYLDDTHEAEEEKKDIEAGKKSRKLAKTLNRLVDESDKEYFKKKKKDIEGIKQAGNFRELIETLEKSSGLSLEEDEEYRKFIDRALEKIREDKTLNRSQIRDIEDYLKQKDEKKPKENNQNTNSQAA